MRRFLESFRNAMARFMYGRNGNDQLGLALLVVYIVLMLLRSLVLLAFPYEIISTVFSALMFALGFWIIFRMYSRNLTKRRAENQRFLNWWLPKRNAWNAAKSRRKDKDHAYFACKTCGTWCRVPKGKGSIELTCPKCRSTMRVKS